MMAIKTHHRSLHRGIAVALRKGLQAAAACLTLASSLWAQSDDFENPPIQYSQATAEDPVARLKARLEAGEVTWKYDRQFGYLPELLRALNVPLESQVLVFSKTSLQIHRISPTNPRALYFNDSVYVGYVPGSSLLELAANDRQLGAVFYTLDTGDDEPPAEGYGKPVMHPASAEHAAGSQAKIAEASTPTHPEFQPRILRDKGQCLACHATSRTSGVPGYLVRSIYPDVSGRGRTGTTSYVTDYRSPFEQRWGGWYVTGEHGAMRHLGNVFALDRDDPEQVDREAGANRRELPPRVSPGNYLAPHSDLVALMVLEHQTRVHNLITRANFETRLAIHQDRAINEALGRDPAFRSETTQRRIARVSRELLEGLLYTDELPLSAPVVGTSTFVDKFTGLGPATPDGKSLRRFNLRQRLFEYPLSFLIYTPEFEGLPEPVLTTLRSELDAVLRGAHNEGVGKGLSAELRADLREILRQTKPDLLVDAAGS
jgi:hypothetical protein